jgi:hypothetical protein
MKWLKRLGTDLRTMEKEYETAAASKAKCDYYIDAGLDQARASAVARAIYAVQDAIVAEYGPKGRAAFVSGKREA